MEGTFPGCRACQPSVPPRCPVTKPSHQNAVAVASSWWLNQPLWKIYSSNWIIFPSNCENKKSLKPPPSACTNCTNYVDFFAPFAHSVSIGLVNAFAKQIIISTKDAIRLTIATKLLPPKISRSQKLRTKEGISSTKRKPILYQNRYFSSRPKSSGDRDHMTMDPRTGTSIDAACIRVVAYSSSSFACSFSGWAFHFLSAVFFMKVTSSIKVLKCITIKRIRQTPTALTTDCLESLTTRSKVAGVIPR